MSENKVTSKLPPILIFGILILLVGFIALRMIFDDSNKSVKDTNTSNFNPINLTDQPAAKTSQDTAEITATDPDADALKGTMDFYPIKFPLQKPNDPAKRYI